MTNSGEQILTFDHLSISYGNVQAVRDLTLSIRRGEVVGLVGESGSGKSTVLRSAVGLLHRSGQVTAVRSSMKEGISRTLPKAN